MGLFDKAKNAAQKALRIDPDHRRKESPSMRRLALLLLLVADEQLSYNQVGALTEQTPDAVRGKLHRARKAFAELFQKTA